MRLMFAAILLVASIYGSTAHAQLEVEDGIWSDPSQSGSGFVIELQDNIMAVAAFTYDSSGRAIWFLSTGIYNSSTSTYSSSLNLFAGGQCLGCVFVAPGLAASPGSVSIAFSGSNRGLLAFNGVPQYNIRRNYYAFATPDDVVLGTWATTFLVPNSAIVEGIYQVLNRKVTFANGTNGVAGLIVGSSRTIVGQYDSAGSAYILVADVSQDFNLGFVFNGIGKDTWVGNAYLYRKDQQASDVPPLQFYGSRIAGRTRTQTFFPPPSKSNKLPNDSNWKEVYESIAGLGSTDNEIVPEHDEILLMLSEALQQKWEMSVQ